jgi:hypothetical protein
MMMVTYREILREIERREGNVFDVPIRLSRWRRLQLAARSLFGTANFASPARHTRQHFSSIHSRRSA